MSGTLNLNKGATLNLTKSAPSLRKVSVGLGWDVGSTVMDLDAWAFAKEKGILPETNVCFYNNKNILNNAIVHGGDNRTGEGEGDDETISIDLDTLNKTNVDEIDIVVIIFNQDASLTFGKVQNAFVRLVNEETNEEIAKYQLEDDFFSARSIVFGKLVKLNGEWSFKALGQEIVGSETDATLATVKQYGFN